MSLFQKLTLGAAGLTALCVGLAITFAPHSFYASYGVALSGDPTLLSELRAPGANLMMLGAVIFAGAVRPRMARLSAALGAAVFLAFAFGRMVSLALDGAPDSGIVAALILEIALGALCGLSLWLRRLDRVGPRETHAALGHLSARGGERAV